MHLKDILFAIANFLILFGALFFITRKMISRMFRERKEKIAGELDKAKKAEENAAALENQVNRDNELARQQEKQLLQSKKTDLKGQDYSSITLLHQMNIKYMRIIKIQKIFLVLH